MSARVPRDRPSRQGSGPPFISVVVPVRNEEATVGRVLERLLEQDYPEDRFEILVCDGRSTDGTRRVVAAVAARDTRVRLLDNPGIRSSAGRNVGFRNARGDYALVIDGHVEIPGRDLLRTVAEIFERTGAECLGRPQPLIPVPGSRWSESIALARASWLGHSRSSFIYSDAEGFVPAASVGAAYRREVFEKIGYLDEDFDACEDVEFNTRLDEAGMRCYISPRLTVFYHARRDLPGLWRQMFRYGFGRCKFLLKHPRRLTWEQAALPGFVAWTLSGPAFLLGGLPAAALWAVPVAAYGLLVLIESTRLARRHGWWRWPHFAAIFPVIHFGLGTGFLWSLLRRGHLPPPR
ncbi:MAG: glycosyltransferase family 2 protein [Acidobacteria bacterium]|nr:MAG: glycosyltransferase family 2 protein [Acidobacteriota bacterium]